MRKGDHQGENEPELNPLDVGRWWQLFENADQQGCQRQHDGKVDSYCSVEELWQLEEGGDVAQKDKEKGGEETIQSLNGQAPFEDDFHVNTSPIVSVRQKGWIFSQKEVSKIFLTGQLHANFFLLHFHLNLFRGVDLHGDDAHLREAFLKVFN